MHGTDSFSTDPEAMELQEGVDWIPSIERPFGRPARFHLTAPST